MSAFCVFGMTEPKAKEIAGRKPPPPRYVKTEMQYRQYLAKQLENILANAAPRQVSPPFDAPQFCRDWIDLAQRTVRTRALVVMVTDVKRDAEGNPIISKRTKRPMKAWRPYETSN